jgi:hypothetical protein
MHFQSWFNTQPIAVRDPATRTLMRIAYEAGLQACAKELEAECRRNSGPDMAPKSAEQACDCVAKRIRKNIKGVL